MVQLRSSSVKEAAAAAILKPVIMQTVSKEKFPKSHYIYSLPPPVKGCIGYISMIAKKRSGKVTGGV
jgi:hypothetical protein